jgi:hypothetical protein
VSPFLAGDTYFGERAERPGIEHFLAEAAVEALNVRILVGLP